MARAALPDTRLELYRSEHFLIDKRSGDVVLVVRRTATPSNAGTAREELARITRALEGVDRAQHALLFDLRAAPMNNSPEFAAAAQEFREGLFRGFVAVTHLTSTATGRLQASRFAREEGGNTSAPSEDEEQAAAKLRLAVAEARGRRT